MKKFLSLFLLTLVLVVIVTSCKTPPPTGWAAVAGKEWKLIEVRINDTFERTILFDRKELSADNRTKDIFSITFAENSLGGTAAPNRYNAPYSLGDAQSINILPMRSTMMANTEFFPERLHEHNFFTYVSNVYKWDLRDGKLVLSSKNEEERDVILIFE